MKRLYPLIILLLSLQITAFGKNDKYRLIITDDPSTTMTIGWNQVSGHSVAVFFDEIDHGQDYAAYANFQLPDRTVNYKSMNNYFVRLKDLKPATAYYLVIVDSEGTSQRFWFRTLSNDPNVPLSIVAGGDSRRSGSATTPHEPRIQSNKVVRTLRPDFVAFGGDYTDKDTDGQWRTWMDDWQYTTGEDGLMIPILATRGNHERNNDVMINLFDAPQSNIYYAINFGGSLLRFYTLNVMISVAGDQTQWLRQDLEDNDTKTLWKMAQYHYAIAPHQSGKSFKTPQYVQWAPLFYDFNVQMIVECDSHVAKNTWPIKPTNEAGNDRGFIRDDEKGNVYVGEGSWGLIRSANVDYEWTRDKGSFTQVKWMHVSKDSVVSYTIKSAESAFDATVSDDNRFAMPTGLTLWDTEYGDRVVLTNPNPRFEQVTTPTEDIPTAEMTVIKRVFPNPTQTNLNVELFEFKPYNYTIYDISGRALKSGLLNEQISNIKINDLSNGHYYLKVWNRANTASQVEVFIKN